jgi:hypothetical protein
MLLLTDDAKLSLRRLLDRADCPSSGGVDAEKVCGKPVVATLEETGVKIKTVKREKFS